MDREATLARLLEQRGPLTGAGLLEAAGFDRGSGPGGDPYRIWQAAAGSPRLAVRTVGVRYLRLDRKVGGYARLSPSILREFLTYSVVGIAGDDAALARKAAEVDAHIKAVSRAKLELARAIVTAVAGRVADAAAADARAADTADTEGRVSATAPADLPSAGLAPAGGYCVFIAGDVVFDMAHDVPRPERSTGQMVRGSDLDLVVIVDDGAPPALAQRLDEEIYRQKYRYLINPSAREEVDYIVKPFSRMREQARFDSFKRMVACKILQEGVFLHGDERLFAAAKALLAEHGVSARLDEMEAQAISRRAWTRERLLTADRTTLGPEELQLFFTADESEEFE